MSDWFSRRLGQRQQQPQPVYQQPTHVPGMWPGSVPQPQYPQQQHQQVLDQNYVDDSTLPLIERVNRMTAAGKAKVASDSERFTCPQCNKPVFTLSNVTGVINENGQSVKPAGRCYECGWSQRYGMHLTEKGA